eukprot:13655433-Alexandrium_andersonii.AAC.1
MGRPRDESARTPTRRLPADPPVSRSRATASHAKVQAQEPVSLMALLPTTLRGLRWAMCVCCLLYTSPSPRD